MNLQEDCMPFFFDKSFKQAIESNSKIFNKQSVVIAPIKNDPGPNLRQNSSTNHKNH